MSVLPANGYDQYKGVLSQKPLCIFNYNAIVANGVHTIHHACISGLVLNTCRPIGGEGVKRFKSWRVFYLHVEAGKAQLSLEASRCKTDIRRAKISGAQHASIFQDSSQFQIILYYMSSLLQFYHEFCIIWISLLKLLMLINKQNVFLDLVFHV